MKSSIALIVVLFGVAYGSGHWGYQASNGPDTWSEEYPLCAGEVQSPINIDTTAVTEEAIDAVVFNGYDDTSATLTLANNGHSAKLSTSGTAYITGGGLDETFYFAQLHFHWGSTSTVGSEHTVDGVQYPAEIHFVHWRESLGTFDSAAVVTDGLAIVGVLLEVSAEDNPAFDKLVAALEQITYNGESTTPASFALRDLLPSSTDSFYRYTGSLTTPDCNESGIWTVLRNKVSISESQLAKFRALYFNAEGETDLPMVDNFRPVQALNGRVVKLATAATTTVAADTTEAVTVTEAATSTVAQETTTASAGTTTTAASTNAFRRFFNFLFGGK